MKDGSADDLVRQPEQIKAFRDTWELGIHSYLAYLRDRLVAARELLTESGSIFVQIGDENVHLVRAAMDEVFGAENFCSQVTYVTTTTASGNLLNKVNDFLLWYARDKGRVKYRPLYFVGHLGHGVAAGLAASLQFAVHRRDLGGILLLGARQRGLRGVELPARHRSPSPARKSQNLP